MNRYMIGTAVQAADTDEDSMDPMLEALDLTPSWGEIMGDDGYRYEIGEPYDPRSLVGVDTIPNTAGGTRTEAGSSASAAHQDTQAMARGEVPPDDDHAQAASDAAKAAANAAAEQKTSDVSQAQMLATMGVVTGIAFDPKTPPPSEAAKKKIADAANAVKNAKTPEEKKDAQDKVVDAAKTVSVEKNPKWLHKPLFVGSTMERWHGIVIVGGAALILTGFGIVARRA